MSGGPYSHEKVFHHRARIDALRNGESIAPLHVQIIPTNICNHDCSFCAYRMSGYTSNADFVERDTIPFEKIAEIIEDCHAMGVRAIEVTGGGEPTVYRSFLPMVGMILEHGIDLGLVTNGSRWSVQRAAVLARAKWIRFSMDAGNPQTYSSVRRIHPRNFDKAREALRMQAAAPNRDQDQLLGVGFVVTKENWREVVHATRNAREDGADNIRISAVFQNDGAEYFREFHDEAAELCREAQALETDTFRVFNLFGDRFRDVSQGAPDYSFCGVQHFATYIGADLNVYRCCNTAYNKHGFLGRLNKQRFRQLWESVEVQKKLWNFDARSCQRCMFNNKNRTILYAIADNPRHVNFL